MRLDEKKYIFKQRMMNIIHNTLRDTWFKRVNSHAISLQLLIDAIGASDDVSIRIHYTNYQSYQIIVNKNVILIFDGDRRQITIIIATIIPKVWNSLKYFGSEKSVIINVGKIKAMINEAI